MIRITVPATSANVGVGYDTLGLALTLFAHFDIEAAEELTISGCPAAYQGPDNLVYSSMCTAWKTWGVAQQGARIHIASEVPFARGLGSSSTCVVAGVLGAAALAGLKLSAAELLRVATLIEGHPDNVAPALLGSLVCSFTGADGTVQSLSYTVHPDLNFVAMIPSYEVKTEDARRVVPQEIALATGVAQIGRAAGMIRGLETGDEALLRAANHDLLHEPYRQALIPEYSAVRDICQQTNMATLWISGSGPSLLAVSRNKLVAQGCASAVRDTFPAFAVHVLGCDTKGARVETIDGVHVGSECAGAANSTTI
ncbi:homoserine kinase [Collinsella sp. zg1085]|uniref:homoserine kinase n=1 Tax=Collinsella sp. zg1085 TaxID=2844380 RepID=UPI001C0D1794|nr:homoserine kinase [Collinsella sp. zg1085]QWT17831.1 homoserine kinase [Collinsella sp. zg1085]